MFLASGYSFILYMHYLGIPLPDYLHLMHSALKPSDLWRLNHFQLQNTVDANCQFIGNTRDWETCQTTPKGCRQQNPTKKQTYPATTGERFPSTKIARGKKKEMKGKRISLKKKMLCASKDTIKKEKKKWEKSFISNISKRLISRNYIEFLQLNNKNPI